MEGETEAMASQSLNVVDDIFSKLPKHIIHCILDLLPSTKDVVRSSSISKSWLQAWLTFPIPEFNLLDFVSFSSIFSGEEDEAKSKQFIRFVDNTLQRFGSQDGDGSNGYRMKIFKLRTVSKMAHHHTNRWIGTALENKVEHLDLDILPACSLPCLIPDRVISAHWLKSLRLEGPTIYIPLTEGSHVDLPSLTYLYIYDSHITDEKLQKLLRGCPALEDIALLECPLLSNVDIFYHPNLETLEVANYITKLSAIRVRAPKLKSFSYASVYKVAVKIHNSPELKSLKITDTIITDEWFHKFIAQFPVIEDLTIEGCYALRKIRISSLLLEKINIMDCNNLEEVVITCKKLASFTLKSSIPVPSIQIKMENPPNDCTAEIAGTFSDLLMEASFYCKLKELLTGPFTFKSLNFSMLNLPVVDGDMKRKDVHKKLPPAACNIEKLRLEVRAPTPSWCHFHILNGLLSACHPTTIELDFFPDNHFIKLVCEELDVRENKTKCYCEDDFKCWKHQLKEVKIEKIKGIKMEEDLDWDALFDLLPTLKHENNIYFKLMW